MRVSEQVSSRRRRKRWKRGGRPRRATSTVERTAKRRAARGGAEQDRGVERREKQDWEQEGGEGALTKRHRSNCRLSGAPHRAHDDVAEEVHGGQGDAASLRLNPVRCTVSTLTKSSN
eukprot:2123834-Rhodomonas_salina.2